ncbi:MAG TPA: hypothetical protein VHX52_09285 [Steroidobacteraceae bacterium]|nr:hypothetical protein [Steroidobacteraceae bacterium]
MRLFITRYEDLLTITSIVRARAQVRRQHGAAAQLSRGGCEGGPRRP